MMFLGKWLLLKSTLENPCLTIKSIQLKVKPLPHGEGFTLFFLYNPNLAEDIFYLK